MLSEREGTFTLWIPFIQKATFAIQGTHSGFVQAGVQCFV
jgi:hypothetical protein